MNVAVTSVLDAQKFVNELGRHQGDFYLLVEDRARTAFIDAKSILGVVNYISKTPMKLSVPKDFDTDAISSFIIL